MQIVGAHIESLFFGYRAATGCAPTTTARIIVGDPAFVSRYKKTDMRISTYDQFVGRMSGIWPDNAPWPDGVPRQSSIPLLPAGAALLAARLGATASLAAETTPPPDWPNDIPFPAKRAHHG